MSKELIDNLISISVCLTVALIVALIGGNIQAAVAVYCVTLIAFRLGDIAEAIRERPLCINVDKSFVEWVIENLKNKYYETTRP